MKGKTVDEIKGSCGELFNRLSDKLEPLIDEYFSLDFRLKKEDPAPKRFHHIACYAVVGGSEGHYIHIDFTLPDEKRLSFALAKTFGGMENALKIANAATEFFYDMQNGWVYE